MRRNHPSSARVYRLAALILCLCAWFALPTALPARADNICTLDTDYSLCLGKIKKGSLARNASVSYTITVSSGKQIIVGAFNDDAIQVPQNASAPPRVAVTCPNTEGDDAEVSPESGQSSGGGVVYCRPRPASGSGNASVTITLTNTSSASVDYAVFVARLDSATIESMAISRAGQSLGERELKLYSISNNTSTNRNRALTFAVSSGDPTNHAAALIFRQDGSLICGTINPQTCNMYADGQRNYYLVALNSGDSGFGYSVSLPVAP